MKKLFYLLIPVIVLIFINCPTAETTNDDDDDSTSTYTLSGDITSRFTTSSPTNQVTIFLTAGNDINGTRLYSTSTSSWRTTKIIGYYTRYASYSISGIPDGNYYLSAVFDDESNVYDSTSDGPTYISISGNIITDIDFSD